MSYQVDFEPLGRRLRVGRGISVFTAAQQAGVGLVSICGGKGTCGRCKIRVLEGQLSPLSETEGKKLNLDEIARGYRLACHAEVLSDLKLHIPPPIADRRSAHPGGRARADGAHRPRGGGPRRSAPPTYAGGHPLRPGSNETSYGGDAWSERFDRGLRPAASTTRPFEGGGMVRHGRLAGPGSGQLRSAGARAPGSGR